MANRTPQSEWGALFNFAGGGLLHMQVFPIVVTLATTPEERRRVRRAKLKMKQIIRQVQGNTLSPTVALDGTDYDYKAVEGLDLTIENDQEQLVVDFNVVVSFSASPAIVRFALFIDGVLDTTQAIEITSVATVALSFTGFFAPLIGPGAHRIALYMTCDSAVTATYTAKQRRMRVQGLLGS
jgi:hypothetical protein